MNLSEKGFEFLDIFVLLLIKDEDVLYFFLSNRKYCELKTVCRTMEVYQMWNKTFQLHTYSSFSSKHYSTSIRSQSHKLIQLKAERGQAFVNSFLVLALVVLKRTVISCAEPPFGVIRSRYSIFTSIVPVSLFFSKNLI